MPHIVLSGTFCSRNKGDAAMQLAAIQAIEAIVPGAQFTVLAPHPELDREVYASLATVVHSSRRNGVAAFVRLGAVALWRALRGLGIDYRGLLHAPELQTLRDADLLVDLSGDTLTEDYGVRCVISHLMPILKAMLLGRPVVICAQTIGPFGITRPLARFALRRAALITAREGLTETYLADLGVDRQRLELTADLAFLLPAAPATRVDEILAIEQLRAEHRPVLGIAVSSLLGHTDAPRDDGSGQFASIIAGAADAMIERHNLVVRFISHVTGPGAARDDRRVAQQVRERMRHRDQVEIVSGDYRPEEMKGVIGRCDIFLGLRMHANIAALSMRVPTLAIAYSRKTYGIMDMAGQGERICDVRQLDEKALTNALDRLWRERVEVRAGLQARLPEIEREAARNATLALNLIPTESLAIPSGTTPSPAPGPQS